MKSSYVILIVLALSCIASRKVKKVSKGKTSRKTYDEHNCSLTREHSLINTQKSIESGYILATSVREKQYSVQDRLAGFCKAPLLFLRTLTAIARTSSLCSGGSNGQADPIMFGFKPIIGTNQDDKENYLVPFTKEGSFDTFITNWFGSEKLKLVVPKDENEICANDQNLEACLITCDKKEDERESCFNGCNPKDQEKNKDKIQEKTSETVTEDNKYGRMCYNSPYDVGGKMFCANLQSYPEGNEDDVCRLAHHKKNNETFLFPQNESGFTYGVPLNKYIKFFLIKVHIVDGCIKLGCGEAEKKFTANSNCDGYINMKKEDFKLISSAENILNSGFHRADTNTNSFCKYVYRYQIKQNGYWGQVDAKAKFGEQIVSFFQTNRPFFNFLRNNHIRIKLRHGYSPRCLALPDVLEESKSIFT